MNQITHYGHGIYAIDAHYVRPKLAAIHLIIENGRAAFVDTGCNDSLPIVRMALAELGIEAAQVDYVILTHIHLDHAGGAGAMMRAFPNALLVVHPRGARHMADPSKLIEGAAAVYGADEVRRLYGDVLPIDVDRIVEATDGLRVELSGRELACLDTPGHARHHVGIVDQKTEHIFTGDIFGLSYRELDTGGRQFIFPTTTPIQFDPAAMHASIDLLLGYQPQAVYLTHFGQLRDVAVQGAILHRLVDAHVAIARREKYAGAERHARIRDGLTHLLLEETSRFGCRLAGHEILDIFSGDLELNAQGLGVWLDSQK
jgi:glyoxylase-like metal-dependent hydrolase (beta-lactamase superfamily II)